MGHVHLFAQRAVLCAAMLSMATGLLPAQEISPAPVLSAEDIGGRTGHPADWSSQHVIFTRNGSFEKMMAVRGDPRFVNSFLQRYAREQSSHALQPANTGLFGNGSSQYESFENQFSGKGIAAPLPESGPTPGNITTPPHPPSKHSKVDLSISLGPTVGMSIGETPAVYTYNYTTPTCSNLTATPSTIGDFVVYTINATPSVGAQANLIGITNLYTTGDGSGFCPGTGPSVLFSYAIGSGPSPLSPVPSLDGSKIAWIENRTTTASYLHITTWAPNEGTTAVWPAAVSGTFVNGSCTPVGSSCDDAIEYTASTYTGCPTAFIAGNGHSDLYVDYPSNSGFISANNGLLLHIKNIFSSTSAPVVDFCTVVNSTFEATPSSAMSGPVYDALLNKVFITDSEKIYSYTVNSSSASNFVPSTPPSYTFGNALSLYNYQTGAGPLLDAFNNFLYVFSTYDANGNTSVTQIPTSLTAGSGVAIQLGARSANSKQILFYGAFDNNYNNNGPANATSTLYTCGTDATATTQGLFSIKFVPATGVVNTTPAMSDNKNINPGNPTNGVCSPLTEFYDGTTDRLFVGMGQPASGGGANVVTMWNINTRLTSTATTPTASATGYPGGASGISADNNASSTAQAESIYFSTEQVGANSTAITATGFNVNAIYTDHTHFSQTGGIDGD